MRKLSDIFLGLLDLDLGVSRNDAQAGARCIEQDSVKFGEHFWHFSAIVADYYGIGDAKSVAIGIEGLESLLLQVVCHENT